MITSKQGRTTTKGVKPLPPSRPPEAEDYLPDPNSASQAVFNQSRGTSPNVRDQSNIRKHSHDGVNSEPIDITNLANFIQTVSVAPAWTPSNFFEQFALYKNSTTYRLYAYDSVNKAWRFVVLS